jgi:hypothetical protein
LTQNLATTASPIYSAPTTTAATSTIIGCSFANKTNAPVTVTLSVLRSTVSYAIVSQATVPVGGTLVAIGSEQKVVLIANDVLQASSSVANAIDVMVSVLEIT